MLTDALAVGIPELAATFGHGASGGLGPGMFGITGGKFTPGMACCCCNCCDVGWWEVDGPKTKIDEI